MRMMFGLGVGGWAATSAAATESAAASSGKAVRDMAEC